MTKTICLGNMGLKTQDINELMKLKVQIIGYLAIEVLTCEEEAKELSIYNLNRSQTPVAIKYRAKKAEIKKMFEDSEMKQRLQQLDSATNELVAHLEAEAQIYIYTWSIAMLPKKMTMIAMVRAFNNKYEPEIFSFLLKRAVEKGLVVTNLDEKDVYPTDAYVIPKKYFVTK